MTHRGEHFELLVGQIYRDLGAHVEHNCNLAGMQVDLVATMFTPDGTRIVTAVECKDHASPIGVSLAVEITTRARALRDLGLIDKGVVVASAGFTQDARVHMTASGIECFVVADLRRRVADFGAYVASLADGTGLPRSYHEVLEKGNFISLNARSASGEYIESLTDYLDRWLGQPGALLTLLGEYGSGKTTTCWHFTQRVAAEHLRRPDTRIPVVVELRRLNRAFSLRSFLADFIQNQEGISVRSYASFEKLNREGRFVLIFDGLDEIAAGADVGSMYRHLNDILSLQQGRAKILLTCRANFVRDQADLERVEQGTDLQSMLQQHQGYKVLFVEALSEDQIQQYVAASCGKDWAQLYTALERRPELFSLAERPILLSMLVSTIGLPANVASLSTVRLYRRYMGIWLNRDDWRCRLKPDQRKSISRLLAFEMYRERRSAIHHEELRRRMVRYLGAALSYEDIDEYALEVRTCTFLNNDLQGYYRFVHKSFYEFLVAEYYCERIESDGFQVLSEQLSVEVLNFIAQMMAEEPERYREALWQALKDDAVDGSQARSLSVYLLLKCNVDLSGSCLAGIVLPDGANLSGALLRQADCKGLRARAVKFDRADLSGTDFTDADLSECSFLRATLQRTVFRRGTLEKVALYGSDLSDSDFRESALEGAILTHKDLAKAARLRDKLSLEGVLQPLNTSLRAVELSPLAWDEDEDEDEDELHLLLQALGDTKRQLLATLSRKDEQHSAEIDTFTKRLRSMALALEEPDRITKEEYRKRKSRQKHRSVRIRIELALRRLEYATHHVEGLHGLRVQAMPSRRAERAAVDRSQFADSSGLTKEQESWLRRGGAILRREDGPAAGL